MPGKSGHKRGKRPYQSHKSKVIARRSDGIVQQGAPETKSAQVSQSVPDEVKFNKPATAAAMPAANVFPYIRSELGRIGLLFGIILIILIVLSLTLK